MSKATSQKYARLEIANRIIQLIAVYGRHFFCHEGRVSQFELAANGKLWFVDGYTEQRVYVMCRWSPWRGFTEGGTLRRLVENLADFIVKDAPIRNHWGPWPESLCEGDLWGYGPQAMEALRADLRPLLAELTK